MRVPLSWLREFVDFDLDAEALAERLTLLGMEVRGIERTGADWSSVVVGELLDVVPHPGSDRLSLTRVTTGEGSQERSIVCGATNIKIGQRVPVALPGAVLPGGKRIDISRIAGEESEGMLCSGAELGLTTDADGILILDEQTPLGAHLSDLLGDVVLDVDVKPNRGDALSVVGLAREVAAALGTAIREPVVEVAESGDATGDHITVEVLDPLLCPRFVARYLDGVTVGPSPMAVQVRLMAAGVRPISNVVDASNYVMLELGKPTHAFDAAHVTAGHIVVRTATAGERLETLDHVRRDLTADTLVIADASGPLAIAGVMGGASSEVNEATTSVILESAIFDPVLIRRTGQRYALRSEASLRFEKGQESRLARIGADRAAQLIMRWAGGRAATGAVDTDPIDPPPARVTFRPSRATRLLGVEVDPTEMRQLLARVGISCEPATTTDTVVIASGERPLPLDAATVREALVAIVPTHRRDLAIEADVIEEIARVRGYDTLPGRRPDSLMPTHRPDPLAARDTIRDLLAGRGLNEVVTFSLIAPADHERLGDASDDPATIRATNPVTTDHSELRRSLLPELVRVLADNERQRREDIAIFEVGLVHQWIDGKPNERRQLGIVMSGAVRPASWDEPARPADAADAKGLIEWLVERVGSGRVHYEPAAVRDGVEHPGRTASVVVETEAGHRMELGRVGELDPRYLAANGVRAQRAVHAVIDLDGLDLLVPTRRVSALERLPGAERDIAVVVERDRGAGEVIDVVHAAGPASLRSVRLFDRYQGPPLNDREMSLALRLRFEPAERPLEESELDAAMQDITAALAERLGARLRA